MLQAQKISKDTGDALAPKKSMQLHPHIDASCPSLLPNAKKKKKINLQLSGSSPC
jgi:hypothetical protein